MIAGVAGSTIVVHVASPFFFPANEEEVIAPAINGTLACMRACKAAGVQRCVITSSLAAVQNLSQVDKPLDRFYNESYLSNADRPEGMSAYFKSKMLA